MSCSMISAARLTEPTKKLHKNMTKSLETEANVKCKWAEVSHARIAI